MGSPTASADLDRLRSLAEPLAAAAGLELVHVELRGAGAGRVLRFYLDKTGGLTHADCELLSRQLSAALDSVEVAGGAYTLEVSSPGLDRPLVKADDFQRFAGQKVKVETNLPLDGRRRFSGRLKGWRDGSVVLAVEGGQEVVIAASLIDRARLVPEWPARPARPGKSR